MAAVDKASYHNLMKRVALQGENVCYNVCKRDVLEGA